MNNPIQGKSPLLFVPMETKVREFHAKLFLAMIAVENGYRVIIGGKNLLQEQLQHFDKGIYLDKSVASSKNKWFRRFRRLGNIVTALDEEGLVYFNAQAYQNLRLCEQSLSQITLFFAWGPAHKQVICSKVPTAEKKIICVGNPRFDMLRPELREFYTNKAQKRVNRYGKIILVNTTFSLANHAYGNTYSLRLFENYLAPNSAPDYIKKWAEALRMMFEEYVKMLPVLSQRFPTHSIILRPHPAENFDTWKDITKTMPNVYVRAEGNVLNWIKASEVVIQFSCTTAIEAYMMGVEAIHYSPIDIGEFEQPLPRSLSLQASSCEELIDMVNTILTNKKHGDQFESTEIRKRILHENVSSVAGDLASEKIIAALKKIKIPDGTNRTVQQELYKYGLNLLFKIKYLKKRFIGPKRENSRYTFPGLELSEVEENIAILQAVTGRFAGVKAKSVGQTCFLIYAE
ncbi:hypothetical protein QUF75_00405 [Desulfococcaceae bacterium HSG7]|nr:hypothetical protein [Desulfococcaceae bacterium HSG7]